MTDDTRIRARCRRSSCSANGAPRSFSSPTSAGRRTGTRAFDGPGGGSARGLLEAPVKQAPAVVGPEEETMARELAAGEVLLLENSRYEPGETRTTRSWRSARLPRRPLRQRRFRLRPPRPREHRGRRPPPPGLRADLLLEREVIELTRVGTIPSAAGGRPRRRQGNRQDRGDRRFLETAQRS